MVAGKRGIDMTLKQLFEKRNELHTAITAILGKMDTEKRTEMSEDEKTAFDNLDKEIRAVEDTITRVEKVRSFKIEEGKDDCFRRINKIGKILKSGSKIFIGGMGNLHKPRETQQRRYSFPGLGQFPENGRVLQFMTVWNDKGMCYNAYSGDQKPCPSDEFPIEK
jgi:hypothetical protein